MKQRNIDGLPSDPLGVQQVPNQGTHVLPEDVELVAEHPTRLACSLLELAIGLESRRLDPGRLRAPRTVDELRGSRIDARIVKNCLELGDRGVGGSTHQH
jgi:hypothetical protein